MTNWVPLELTGPFGLRIARRPYSPKGRPLSQPTGGTPKPLSPDTYTTDCSLVVVE